MRIWILAGLLACGGAGSKDAEDTVLQDTGDTAATVSTVDTGALPDTEVPLDTSSPTWSPPDSLVTPTTTGDTAATFGTAATAGSVDTTPAPVDTRPCQIELFDSGPDTGIPSPRRFAGIVGVCDPPDTGGLRAVGSRLVPCTSGGVDRLVLPLQLDGLGRVAVLFSQPRGPLRLFLPEARDSVWPTDTFTGCVPGDDVWIGERLPGCLGVVRQAAYPILDTAGRRLDTGNVFRCDTTP